MSKKSRRVDKRQTRGAANTECGDCGSRLDNLGSCPKCIRMIERNSFPACQGCAEMHCGNCGNTQVGVRYGFS